MAGLHELSLRWYCPRCGQPNRGDGRPCGWCAHWPPGSDTGEMMDRGRDPKPWESDTYRDYLRERRVERDGEA